MLNFSVNPAPLLVIALANFLFSWLWYSPVLFAGPWMKALGIPKNHRMTPKQKKEMPWLMASGLLSSLLLSYFLQVLCRGLGAAGFAQGAVIGIAVWAGFTLTASLGTLFEGRAKLVLLINNGLYLLTYAVFGGILGVWK